MVAWSQRRPRFHARTSGLVPFLAVHLLHRHAERPDMALGIAGAISAVAVELRFRLLFDLRAGAARALAMFVDARLQIDMDRLGVLAVDMGRTLVMVGPFLGDHQDRAVMNHLAM